MLKSPYIFPPLVAAILSLISCKDKDRSFTSEIIRDHITTTLDSALGKNARFTWINISRTPADKYNYTVYGFKENDYTSFYGMSCKSGKWDTIGIYAITYKTATFTLAEINYLKYLPEYAKSVERKITFGSGPQYRKIDEIDIKSKDETQSKKVSIRFVWNQPEGPPVSMPFNEDDLFKIPD